jgi:hypothetical protein
VVKLAPTAIRENGRKPTGLFCAGEEGRYPPPSALASPPASIGAVENDCAATEEAAKMTASDKLTCIIFITLASKMNERRWLHCE